MTIAAGFRCLDGVLLLTDSQHTVGDVRYQGPKLWEIESGEFGSSLLVTAAGIDSTILETVDSLKNDPGICGDSISFETIEGAIRRCSPGKDSTLLIGVKVRSEQEARLLRVEEDTEGKIRIAPISRMSDPPYTFTGMPVADALCREMFRWLYSPGIPLLAMKELAKHVLGRVFKYDHWCGPPVQTGYLFDAGKQIEMIDDFRLPDYADRYHGYLCGVQELLGATICECVDFTARGDADFERSLRELNEELRMMRKNAKGPWLVIDCEQTK